MKVDKKELTLLNYKKGQQKDIIIGDFLGCVRSYDEELIEKLRDVYYGGVPASVYLLSNHLSNRHSRAMTEVLSRAFLDDKNTIDVRVLRVQKDITDFCPDTTDEKIIIEHSLVERTTTDGKDLVYDTANGVVFDKKAYEALQKPIVIGVKTRESIKKAYEDEIQNSPTDCTFNPMAVSIVLSGIEATYNNSGERYTQNDSRILQREVELCRSRIAEETKKFTFRPKKAKKETELK